MKTVIAEKPSVAREIAALLGAREKKEGYLSGNSYYVTWALGHLVAPAMPEDYGITGFQKEALPILPKPFLLTVRKTKKDKGYETDTGAFKQLQVIKSLLDKSNSIIVATDAGREGELIFRYIYHYLQCKQPFERLWISSLTEKAIREGFANLKPGTDFDGLYQAAESRSHADWLVGINASQALTIAAGSGIYSLGRVQTPTLALICKRYLDNRNFRVTPYFQIRLEHRKEFIDFRSLSDSKWTDRKQAEAALKAIQRSGPALVTSITTKTVEEQPPLLYDLTGLQKEANTRLNLSAEETLATAQRLYEQQFITYPRTGSKYIPEDLWARIPALVRALGDRTGCKEAVAKVKWGRFNRRIVNDLKVTDHHGLVTTGKVPSALTAKENGVYDLIALRLLEAIAPVCVKELTNVRLQAAGFSFTVKGCKITEPGWRAVQGHFSDGNSEPLQELPELAEGQELKINTATVLDRKTKPPALYTEATLLSAMENAGSPAGIKELPTALQNTGIGTPATRAAIIETLFTRYYITRQKKALLPTGKGLQVYELVKDKKIADAALTAEWEQALQQIEAGDLNPLNFRRDIEVYTTTITRELLEATITKEELPPLPCPRCRQQRLLLRDQLVKCPDPACNWVQFRTVCSVTLPLPEIIQLITKGSTNPIRGMKSRSGKKFDACIVLDEKGDASFTFERSKQNKHG